MDRCPDVAGYSWDEAADILAKAGIAYTTVISRPTRSFFSLEAECFYVLRQKQLEDGSLQIVLAARVRRAVR